MEIRDSDHPSNLILVSLLVVVAGILFAVTTLKPLWTALDLHVPGEPHISVDFTQPVDSIFYVRNAQDGYQWRIDAPTSLWFHPFVSTAVRLLPNILEGNLRYYLVSQISAFVALILIYKYTNDISQSLVKAPFLLYIPLLPGGIGIATGNAEYPCLMFTTLLILSVVQGKSSFSVVTWGALAILTKPNAIYMIPALAVYFIHYSRTGDRFRSKNSLLGLLSIVLVWLIWMLWVDTNVGEFGAYWKIRQIASVPLTLGPFTFFHCTASIITYTQDSGEHLKFLMAIVVPLVDMWILAAIPLKNEVHRLAVIASLLAMTLITFVINNPNKILVYATTIPGHFAAGILFLRLCFKDRDNVTESAGLVILRRLAGISYIGFCIVTVVFFIIGTPLEWYY